MPGENKPGVLAAKVLKVEGGLVEYKTYPLSSIRDKN